MKIKIFLIIVLALLSACSKEEGFNKNKSKATPSLFELSPQEEAARKKTKEDCEKQNSASNKPTQVC